MFIGRDAFIAIEDRARARDLFARSVNRVEIETHSYCNRRCGYCPNVVGDRLGDNKQMEPAVFSGIIRDLAEIDWKGDLVFNSYNEPLADRTILERIAEARQALRRPRLMIFTNGDYLTPQYVQDLADAGLNYLHISIHMNNADVYSDIYALDRISEVTTRIGIPAKYQTIKNNEFILARAPHRKLYIEVRAINFWRHGIDRGGLIKAMPTPPTARHLPCHFPFEQMVIGFEGTIVPCCHIRSDNEEHRPYRIGNIRDFPSLFQAYASSKLVEWRRHLMSNKPKDAPCASCTVYFKHSKPEELAQIQKIYEQVVVPLTNGEAQGTATQGSAPPPAA